MLPLDMSENRTGEAELHHDVLSQTELRPEVGVVKVAKPKAESRLTTGTWLTEQPPWVRKPLGTATLVQEEKLNQGPVQHHIPFFALGVP